MAFTCACAVGGPEVSPEPDGRGWRKADAASSVVDAQSFRSGVARRCEGQLRTDWTLVPLLRNFVFYYSGTRSPKFAIQFAMEPGQMFEVSVDVLVTAAADLFARLQRKAQKTVGFALGR